MAMMKSRGMGGSGLSRELTRLRGVIPHGRRLHAWDSRQMIDPEQTILVVDDDHEVREVALAVLEAAGYRVVAAASGDDAYGLLLAQPDLRVDVLFTDVVMPGRLDGIDLASAARSLRPGLPVLYASGFPNLVRDRWDSAPGEPVLRKPYRAGELCSAVMGLLDAGG
jgi:CheY-like chemotaxis protein